MNDDEISALYRGLAPKPEDRDKELSEIYRAHAPGSGFLRRFVADPALTALKGAISVPETAVGLADIPTGGAIGKYAEQAGFRPKEAREYLDTLYTPEQQAANRTVQEAKGFFPTIQAALENPSVIAHSMIESAPAMGAGGVIGRGARALAPALGDLAAGALGEGAVSAGLAAEQTRQATDTGLLTPKQAALSATSGAVTGLITRASGRLQRELGISDVDVLLAGGAAAESKKGLVRRMAEGGLTEAFLEEMPQSMQEQALQNIALGRPWSEGVAEAGAMGVVTAAPYGGIAGAFHAHPPEPPPPPAGPLEQAAQTAAESGATRPDFPFTSAEAAQRRADTIAAETGVAHGVGPHPQLPNRYIALPAAAIEATEGEAKPEGQPAPAEAAPMAAAAETAASPIVAPPEQRAERDAGFAQADVEKSAQLDQLQRESHWAKADFDAEVERRMTGGEPLQTAFQKAFEQQQHRQAIDAAAHEAATSPLNEKKPPTEAQERAGNYPLGHPKPKLIQGLNISIENPAGSVRRGTDADGKPWETTMPAHYGYIRGTEAADGHKLDVYLGPYPGRPTVFVVDQNDPKTGQFDEHKAMIGFDNAADAEAAYRAAYTPDWQGFGGMTAMSMPEFKQWIKDPANLKTQAGVSHAETLRSDAGQIRQPGDELRPGADQGGENLQREQEAQGGQALEQAGTGAETISPAAGPVETAIPAAGIHQDGLGETGLGEAAALGPETPTAPVTRVAKLVKAAKVRRTVDVTKDSLFTAIGKLGGLNIDEARKTWGLDPKDQFASGVFGRPVLTKEGRSLDDLTQALAQHGYLPTDEHGRADITDLEEAFGREHGGQPVFTSQGHEAQAEARSAELGHSMELSDEEARRSGLEDLSPAGQASVGATVEGDALDMGVGRMTDEEIDRWLDEGPRDVTQTAARGAGEGETGRQEPLEAALGQRGASEEKPPDTGAEGKPAFELSQESEADIARREAEIAATREREAADAKAAEAKAAADRERSSFELTGSKRPADSNPRQLDLTSQGTAEKTEGAQAKTAESPEIPKSRADQAAVSASERIAQWVKDELEADRRIGAPALFQQAYQAFGGTQGQGKYTPKDAYDALELGVNQYISVRTTLYSPRVPAAVAKLTIGQLNGLLQRLPTQTKRTGETDEFQQFSTPPTYAFLANWVANVQHGETYVEPSAGIGGLAVFGKIAGAKVVVNELSPRRAAVLKAMGFERTFSENAEQLNNVLPDDVKPTVIVMNPPFSATAGRMPGARETMNGARHIEQALKRLEPNGRLVAIVGEGMAADRPAFRDWWRKIQAEYSVRANIGIEGKGYAKYGTTFDNQLLVIDKTGPTSGPIVTDKVETPADALPLLEAIRNERVLPSRPTATEPAPSESPGVAIAEPDRLEEPKPRAPLPGGPALVGGGRGTGGGSGRSDAGRVVRPGRADVGGKGGPSLPADNATGRNRQPGEPVPPAGDLAASRSPEPNQPSPLDSPRVAVEAAEAAPKSDLDEATFEAYRPQRLSIPGAKPHPGKLVQSAAMAAVEPPAATYQPNLPKTVVTEGKLSLAQIEAVVYAGQAFQQILPDGSRRGFFIGDGTGVGKGREIAGIILDNLRSGQSKAVWMSEKQGLMKDAKRDFAGIGGDPDLIFNHNNAAKYGEPIKASKGILFTTYATLRVDKAAAAQKKGVLEAAPSGASRLQQIVDWLGKDFDGVIVFDEAHNAGNAIAMKGDHGTSKASAQALKVIDLQDALPQARILYVSATGATEVSNLSYAKRLGLWGENTAFPSTVNFIGEIEKGGLASMELVARDMKQMGMYLARSLSYDGVTYSKLEHMLTPLQTDIYNEVARAWQGVLKNIHAALQLNGADQDADAKGAALAKFWGAQQRFFNQVLTAMQMPAVIAQMHTDLKAGHAVVLQLVNTNEAAQNRQLAARANEAAEKGEAPLEDLDLTPREQLMQYVQNGFPVAQYEEYSDDNGNVRTRPAVDSNGNPVLNKDAVTLRDKLLDNLREIRVPDGPLEIILNEFGHDKVAEVTGRGKRVVRERDDKGNQKLVVQTRGRAAVHNEAEAFQNDKRQILVFSDAGGTGFSFQSDLGRANQRRRMHYLIQPGWRANKAVQGFGRTHRTNQANAPHYYLPTTNLPAQKRFVSSIARRLDQLGALTKGQREATNQGLFSAKDNLEGPYANTAINGFFNDLYRNRIPGMSFSAVAEQLGFDNLIDKRTGALNVTKLPSVPQFLNRLLSLDTVMQETVFAQFSNRMDALIDNAIANGMLETGMQTLRAKEIRKVSDQPVYTDAKTGAITRYVELELQHDTVLKSFASFAARVKRYDGRWVRNTTSGKVWAQIPNRTTTTAAGDVMKAFIFEGTTSSRNVTEDKIGENFAAIDVEEAKHLWEAENAARPQTYSEHQHMIVGSVLPIWDRLGGHIAVARAQTVDGERVLGRIIHPDSLKDTLQKLGASSSALAQMTPAKIMQAVLGNQVARLANDWTLFRARVSGENRIEIGNVSTYDQGQARELQRLGAIAERISWNNRYFIPTGEAGERLLAKLLETKPLASLEKRGGASEDDSGTEGPQFSRRGGVGGGVNSFTLTRHLNTIAGHWQNAPAPFIAQRFADLPDAVQARILAGGGDANIEGVYEQGRVYLVADNLASLTRAEAVWLHETVGHHGLRALLGERLTPLLNQLYETNANVREVASQRMTQFGYSQARATDEALAEMAERGEFKLNGWQRFVAAIRNALRKLGFTLAMSDNDVRALLARSYAGVVGAKPGAPTARFSPSFSQAKPVFYSELEAKIAAHRQQVASAGQWQAIIRNLPSIKADEVNFSGVNEWLQLQGPKVTREALLDYLKQGGVKVEETRLGGKLEGAALDKALREADLLGFDTLREAREAYREAPQNYDLRSVNTGDTTKFDKWQLPGGENYRELVMTLPTKPDESHAARSKRVSQLADQRDALQEALNSARPGSEEANELNRQIRNITTQMDMVMRTPVDASAFRSKHFDEPNVIAHVRFNERTDTDGKRVLFIEELQSDWGQQGKREGFGRHERYTVVDQTSHQRGDFATRAEAEAYLANPPPFVIARLSRIKANFTEGIPEAPFVTKTEAWTGLLLKRMIRYAAEHGFDRVAWTTGEQQADRYDMSKQVMIDYYRKPNGEVWVHARQVGTGRDVFERTVPMKDLPDLIGKEVADKIARGEGDSRMSPALEFIKKRGEPTGFFEQDGKWYIRFGEHELFGTYPSRESAEREAEEIRQTVLQETPRRLAGDDLKVGGEGMRAFYGKIVPNVANDLLKKFGGGRVTNINMHGLRAMDKNLPQQPGESIADYAARNNAYEDAASSQAGFDITPALRERALGGLPLFARGQRLAPNGQPSKLTDSQWQQVRTPEFKGWFGDWELAGLRNRLRDVRGSDQARQAASAFLNEPLTNAETGMVATVSGESLGKMMSRSAVAGSLSPQAHMLAVGNLDTLFALATKRETRAAKKDTQAVSEIHHFDVPMPFDGDVLRVKILAKEFIQKGYGTRLYLVQAVEIEKPTSIGGSLPQQSLTQVYVPPASFEARFAQMVAAVKGNNVSKVVDENGEPRVVYHGTHGDFSAFAKERIRAHGLGGFWFAERADYKGNLEPGEGFSQMPVFLNIRRPVDSSRFAMAKKTATTNNAVQNALRDMGGDGVRLSNEKDNVWIALQPNQIKSAMANVGTFDKGTDDIRFSRRAPRETFNNLRESAQPWLSTFTQNDRSIGPLMASVNTQYHKAEMLARQGKPEFKAVFDLGQRFLSDTTLLAAQAAQLAPNILHQPKTFKDWSRGAKDADVEAIDRALNEGTLYGGGNPLSGIRWNDEQLRRIYQLNDRQIGLYNEYLDAAAESVDILAKSQIARHAKTNGLAFDRDLSLPDMAARVVEQLESAIDDAKLDVANANDQDFLNDMMESTGEPERTLAMYQRLGKEAEAKIERLEKTIGDVNAIADRAARLRDAGYKPLMRFGTATVTAYDAEGKVAFYGMYEGMPFVPKSDQAAAKRVAAELQRENPEWTVKTGILNEEEYKLYAGINLEALQLFADHMDAAAKEPYQEYLRKAVNNRSALKRMIGRKGTPGFSRDARRTLAQFVTSNGRLASAEYQLTDMRKAAEAIPQEQGDVGREAVRLHEYLTQPKEDAGTLRGVLFFNYLGGSIAAAMINLTQVPVVTAPYLGQFTSYANSVKQLVAAAKPAMQNPQDVTGALGEALKKAEADGVTAPQDVHQLMAMASNNVFAGAKSVGFALQAWGKFFSIAEQFNRRTTFIAAYRIAEGNGLKGQAAFDFAEKAVKDTQFIYNKGNRPNWARGAVGATVFTFKQFNIMYLELLKRLPWKQRAIMLGTLVLFAGAGGLPFEEDIEDLIDTLGQWLGFATNAKRTIRNTVKGVAGEDIGNVVLKGVSGALPFDISGRMGMPNLIPGTAILKPSQVDKKREVIEAGGPAASLLVSLGDALQALATGHYETAALETFPVAVRNLYQGIKMGAKGYGEDFQGRKTLDVSPAAAAFKTIGFNPAVLAQFSEAKQGFMQKQNLMSLKQEQLNSDWADAIIAHDSEGIDQARQGLIQWNTEHPDMPLRFNPAAIRKRVIDAQMDGDMRFIRGRPKGLRREAMEELRR